MNIGKVTVREHPTQMPRASSRYTGLLGKSETKFFLHGSKDSSPTVELSAKGKPLGRRRHQPSNLEQGVTKDHHALTGDLLPRNTQVSQ